MLARAITLNLWGSGAAARAYCYRHRLVASLNAVAQGYKDLLATRTGRSRKRRGGSEKEEGSQL